MLQSVDATWRRRPSRERGQAATETMLMMFFLMLLVFGLVHMCMLLTTKSFVNYAAFSVARTHLIGGDRQLAADEAMRPLDWWNGDEWRNRKIVEPAQQWDKWLRERDGFIVRYHVPFGIPFQDVPPEGVAITGFAPAIAQPHIEEKGDNSDGQ
jgi:hypothetical protein